MAAVGSRSTSRPRFEPLEDRRLLSAAPVGVADQYTVLAGEMLVNEPGVLANDYDADGDELSAVLVGAPRYGAVSLAPDGGFRYLPNRGFAGDDSFIYRARATDGESGATTVTITAKKVLSPVVWSAGTGGNGHAYGLVSADGGWTQAKNHAESLSYAGVHGHLATITSQAEQDWLMSRFGYVNAYLGGYQDHSAPDYTEPDGGWRWITGEPWEFTGWGLEEPNDAEGGEEFLETMGNHWNDIGERFPRGLFLAEFPAVANVAGDDLHQVAANTTRKFALFDLLRNDVLPSPENARLSNLGVPGHGDLTEAADGSLTYVPAPGFVGIDSFTYRVVSDSGESNPATVWLKVGLDEYPLVVQEDTYLTEEDVPYVSNGFSRRSVLSNDSDRDTTALTAELVSPPVHGTIELKPNGSFRYTPTLNFFGIDEFYYRAVDGPAVSPPVRVEITVMFVNDPPFSVGDQYELAGSGPYLVSEAQGVLANDVDPDLPLTAELVLSTDHGTLDLSSDGAFTYTPQAAFRGVDRFAYRAFDYFDYTPATSVLLAVDVIFGDANLDGLVDLNDFGALKASFGKTGATLAQGDLDGDAQVDLDDFGLLKENFGRSAGPRALFARAEAAFTNALASAATPDVQVLGWLRWSWDQRNGKPENDGDR